MRVQVLAPVEFAFDGQDIVFAAGTGVGTPLADFMVREGMPVEVLDATLDPAAVVTCTEAVVLDWVGNDPTRAGLALAAEQAGSNRPDLIAALTAVGAG